MARPSALAEDEAQNRLAETPGWTIQAGKLTRKFKFKDFTEAFAFMTRAALYAEKIDHHPEWSNVYNRVEVELVTHDAKGLTTLDFELAAFINRCTD